MDSNKLVKTLVEGAPYDEYLKVLEGANDGSCFVPSGTIVFPIPLTYEEYEISGEVKGKILFSLYQQYLFYGPLLQYITLWSLQITSDVKNLTTWEDLDPSDYTIILSQVDHELKLWGIIADEKRNIAYSLILSFDKSNKSHMQIANELSEIENNKIISEDFEKTDFVTVIIPVERIIGIVW